MPGVKSLRNLGLRDGSQNALQPVEKLVELKTMFEISFSKDRAVGSGEAARRPLNP